MNYTITLTIAEKIAMEYIASDVQEWISNATKVRAASAIKQVQDMLVAYCNENNIAISVGEEAQMQQAKDLGLLDISQQQVQ